MTDTTNESMPETVYECTFTNVAEDASRVKVILKKYGATILSERSGEKVKLMYPIKKQVFAFLSVLQFSGVSDIDALSKELASEGNLLRFMIHRANPHGETAQAARFGRPAPSHTPRTGETSLTNEAIEKKIEEILK